MIRIALLTALSQEHTHLRRITSPWTIDRSGSIPTYRKRLPGVECILLETGMGRRSIERALELSRKAHRPDLILSAGFAGSLDPRLAVGKVCLGEQFLFLAGSAPPKPEGSFLTAPVGPVLRRFGLARDLENAPVATVETVQDKGALVRALGGSATLVDMESYFAARTAAEQETAFVSIRSVSDGLRDAIDFDVAILCDSEGRIRTSRVLRQVARSPRLMMSLGSAWKRSRRAAASLAKTLRAFLELPSDDLDRILREQRVSIVCPHEA